MEWLNNLYLEIQNNPLRFALKSIALLFSIIGFAQAFEWIINANVYIQIPIVIIALIITISLLMLRKSPASKLHAAQIDNEKNVVTSQHHILDISDTHEAIFTKVMKMICISPLDEGDYTDYVQSSGNEKYESANYKSDDSNVTSYSEVRDDLIEIKYKPHNPPSVNQEWTHSFSWTPSHKFGGEYDCIRLAAKKRIGTHETIVNTHIPIESVICFREPPIMGHIDTDELAHYALNLKNTHAPPVIEKSENGFIWRISNPKLGSIYCCMWFYKNGVDAFPKKFPPGIMTRVKILMANSV